MTDIQRYNGRGRPVGNNDVGIFVLYADHVEALRQAHEAASNAAKAHTEHSEQWAAASYEQGQRDALAAAAQRVEALDCQRIMATQPNGLPAAADYVERAAVIAAIKGES